MKKELLIFGANSPLGIGVTRSLIKKDFDRIYLFARSYDEIEFSDEKILKIQTTDLSAETNVADSILEVKPSEDKLLFLFSAIGSFTGGKSLWETDSAELDKMLNINVKVNFLLAKYFSGIVKNSAGGSICFTSAYTGLHPEKNKSVYGLAKAALIHLVKTLALEGKDINLAVNAIAPFIIDTPENRNWMKDTDFDKTLKPVEIGEFVYDIFRNYNFITGNIFEMPHRLKADFH